MSSPEPLQPPYNYDILYEAVALIVHHPHFQHKNELKCEASRQIDHSFEAGKITKEQRKLLWQLLHTRF